MSSNNLRRNSCRGDMFVRIAGHSTKFVSIRYGLVSDCVKEIKGLGTVYEN